MTICRIFPSICPTFPKTKCARLTCKKFFMIYCVFYVILFSLFLFYTSLFLFIDYDVLTKATTPFGIVAYR